MGLIVSVNSPLVGNRYKTIQPVYLYYDIVTNKVSVNNRSGYFRYNFEKIGNFCIKIDPGLKFEVTKIDTSWILGDSSTDTFIKLVNNIPVNPDMSVKTIGYNGVIDETVKTTINPFLTDMIVDNKLQVSGLVGDTSFFTYIGKPTNIVPKNKYIEFIDRASYVAPYDNFQNILSYVYFMICLIIFFIGVTR